MKQLNSTVKLYQSADFKLLSNEDSSVCYIEGYASVYRNSDGSKQIDRDGEVVNTDAMDITSYLKNPVLIWNHNWDKPIGKVTEVTKDVNGLYIKAEVHKLNGMEGKFESVLKGLVKSFSIGFVPSEFDFLQGDILEISKASLVEISIAPVQSNPEALFRVVGTKSLGVSVAEIIKQNGIDINDLKVSNKGDNMKKQVNVENVETNSDAQEVGVSTSASVEPNITVSNNTVETPKATEVAPIIVQPTLDIASLAQALVNADVEANRLKAEQEKAQKEAEEQAIKDAEDAKVQREKDAFAFIQEKRDVILNAKPSELDIDSLENLYELLDSTKEAIEAKVIEAISLAKAGE